MSTTKKEKPKKCSIYPTPCRIVQCYVRTKDKGKIKIAPIPYYYCIEHKTLIKQSKS